MSNPAKVIDLEMMPNFNSAITTRGRDSISQGKVRWDQEQKAVCIAHGAMNCVSENRRLWRCVHAYTCGEGCWVEGDLI